MMAKINTGYILTESNLKMCTDDLNKTRRICNENYPKYIKNFYEGQKKIYSLKSLKSTKLCAKFPDLKKCAGNVLFH